MSDPRGDIGRITLNVLFIGGLTLASFWVLRPFLASFIWAVMIVVSTWPMMRRVEAWLGGRRAPAVVVMTIVMLLVFVLPLVLAIGAMTERAVDAAAWVTSLAGKHLPEAPPWLATVPLIGPRATAAWDRFAGAGFQELIAPLEPYTRDIGQWLLSEAGTFGALFVQGLLIVILSAVLYASGDTWAAWVIAFGRRLAADRGEAAIVLAGQAIRGVALGVVVTALLQSALGGIGSGSRACRLQRC